MREGFPVATSVWYGWRSLWVCTVRTHQTEREKHRQKERNTNRQTEREKHKQTERKRETQKEKNRETVCVCLCVWQSKSDYVSMCERVCDKVRQRDQQPWEIITPSDIARKSDTDTLRYCKIVRHRQTERQTPWIKGTMIATLSTCVCEKVFLDDSSAYRYR